MPPFADLRRLWPPLILHDWREHRIQHDYLATAVRLLEAREGQQRAGRGVYGEAICEMIMAVDRDCDTYESWCWWTVVWAHEMAAAALGGRSSIPRAGGGVVRAWVQAQRSGLEVLTWRDIEAGKVPGPGWVMLRTRSAVTRSAAVAGELVPAHAELVSSATAAEFHTIGGNTNAAGSATGGAIARQRLAHSDPRLIGSIRPRLVIEAAKEHA